jgi:hypothetical protein
MSGNFRSSLQESIEGFAESVGSVALIARHSLGVKVSQEDDSILERKGREQCIDFAGLKE